jgi:hypothetical protein
MKRIFAIVLATLLLAPSAGAQEASNDSESEPPAPAIPEPASSPAPSLTPSARLAACVAAEEYDRRAAAATSPAKEALEKIAAQKHTDCASTPTAQNPVAHAMLAPPAPAPPSLARVYGAFEGGYAAQTLVGVAMSGVDLTAQLGAALKSWDIGVQVEVVPARTEGGLSVLAGTVAPIAQAHVGRLRIGGGFRFGGFYVHRATTNDSLSTLTIGIGGRVSFDVVRFDDEGKRALFLVGKGSLDALNGSLFCATIGAGVRF